MAGKQSHKMTNAQMIDHIVELVEKRAEEIAAQPVAEAVGAEPVGTGRAGAEPIGAKQAGATPTTGERTGTGQARAEQAARTAAE